MSSVQTPTGTNLETLAEQLKHPSAEAVWNRAEEVFGNRKTAESWMSSNRNIFDGQSPEELLRQGDETQLRRVLEILIRIDYGVFS